MKIENLSEEFERELKEKEMANTLPVDSLWEASRRFENIYKQRLIETAQSILESDSVSPIVKIIEEAVRHIATKEGLKKKEVGSSEFGHWDKYVWEGYFLGSRSEFERNLVFNIKHLKKIGDKCYSSYEDEGKFVEAIENGDKISDLINGFRIEYRMVDTLLALEVTKDDKGDFSIINWVIGDSEDSLRVKDFDYSPLIKIFTSKIAQGKFAYTRHCSGGTDMGEGWSIN